LQKLSTPRRLCWARAVPSAPGEAPITAAGMWLNEFSVRGRDAQSIAFFIPPGIERLYSGVTMSTAWTSASAFLNATATGGKSPS
jgi:hypothetical protein